MDAKLPEINLGAAVCERLRTLYHGTKPWGDCFKEVAQKFTELKVIARKFYCDKTELEMLREIARYSIDDIKEMFNHGNADHTAPPGHIEAEYSPATKIAESGEKTGAAIPCDDKAAETGN